MKQFCLLLIAVFLSVNAFSQAAVAKIKYEEAEEAYAANDYATTLSKLDEVESMLGQTNPRVLYLRITSQDKLRKAAPMVELETIRTLRKNCQDYLVKYESVEGIEDKYKEVYKISESVKNFATADKAFANAAKELPADMDTIAHAYYKVKNYGASMEWFRKAAAKNDAYALTRLGYAYCYGEGVKEDNVKALEYFQKAAALNEPSAMYYVGLVHYYGWEVPKDSAKAMEWIQKSYETALPFAEKGSVYHTFLTGRALSMLPKPDWDIVADWYGKGAAKGNTYAINSLASWYMNGIHVEKDVPKAVGLYKSLTAAGDAAPMYSLGYQYYTGNNTEKDLVKAREWFTSGAEHGDGSCAFYMGYMYANGEGVERDYTQAAYWYQLGGERRNRSSLNNLGVLYENGNGVTQSNAKAIECYTRAADLGNEYAMNNLGTIYRDGKLGKAVDYAKAQEWYKKAAQAGKVDAMYNYAKLMEEGKGAAADYTTAIEWYTKAADKGYKEAYDKLYSIYYNGLGVKRDKKKAEEWLNKKMALK